MVSNISNVDTSNLTDKDFKIYVSRFVKEVISTLNNGITIDDNISCKVVSVVFTAASVESRIEHGLGRVPVGYIQIGQSAVLTVFNGATTTTNQNIYLQSSAAGTVKLLIW